MKKKVHIILLMFILTLFTGKLAVSAEKAYSINVSTATVNIGDADNKLELELVKTNEDWGGVIPNTRWSSFNVNVAAVEQEGQKGIVTPLRKGTTIVSSGVGFPRETCIVKVVTPGIKLNKKAANLYIEPGKESGQTVKVKATVTGADKTAVWSSSDDAVATVVSTDGKTATVTARSEGNVTITASANGKTESCVVTVKENKLSLNVNSILVSTRGNGSSVKLVPTVVGPGKKVKWESADSTVAKVSGGKVTGKKTGETTVKATANGVTVECKVEVKEGLLSINEEHVLLYVTAGSERETKALKTNAAGTEKVTWSSSDETVATVDNDGKVTAVGAGIAKISAVRQTNGESGADGSVNVNADSCIVEVKKTKTDITDRYVYLKTKGSAKTYQLGYNVVGRKSNVTWKSSDNKIVSVSKGKITAKKVGKATITAKANGVEDKINVIVQEYTPSIKLNQGEYTLYTGSSGKTVTLKATVDGPSKKVTWASSDREVASVSTAGKVTALKEGRALITATANGKTANCWISVKEPKVILHKTAYILGVGEKAELETDIVGASQTVKYTTSNAKIAAVNKGVVTAKKVGEATIKVTANGVTATCKVTVSACGEDGHQFAPMEEGDEYSGRAATCLESGILAKKCTVCGGIKQEVTEPLGHSYGKWSVIAKATENAAGLERQICTRCGAENTRSIPAKNKGENASSYTLVWEDDFNGDSLNMDDWNYEYHEPGWVNAELQEYVDSPENIYVKDGNLTIQALKTTKDGKEYYTSGRINTQNKHDYQYGRFEARAKVPSGKGFLPAFWMMPTDESYYGQWPKCGEIDIMEVHGSDLTTSYSTLHFGEPHTQKQGTYTLPEGADNFGEDFHVYACEWDPDEFRFYVDGELFYTVNDWFTKRSGFGEVAYPAPYDQPFYMILNLAVGGSWVGYPDEGTLFDENAQLVVDYVRVYRKNNYDYDIDKPDDKIELRDPDESGNYIINGDFAQVEDLEKGDENWQLLLTGGGDATAEISGNALHIMTTNAGTLNYSVQVVQSNLPIEQGSKYKLTYEAYADANRTMITGLTAPDNGYIRYLADTTVDLTTEKQTYTHVFDMTENSDANGRVEFNLGNQGSTATVHITNVRLEKAGDAEEEVKSVLPDGNYVYNGQFNEGNEAGKLRLAYWDWDAPRKASVSVTNDAKREMRVVVPATVSKLEDVVVSQDPIAIKGGKQYVLSFTARADGDKTIQTTVAGETFVSSLTKESKEYRYEIDATEKPELNGTTLKFLLGTPGTIWIDDVSIREDGMIINGDFSSGMIGYELYVHDDASASAIVDELTEDKALCIDIMKTGGQDWMIQLKQNNVKLEEGKWYNISFDAKSTMDRTIMYALQRDGTSDDIWTPYSGTQKIKLTSGYRNFSTTFKMASATDPATILSISMGAVNGTVINTKHTVTIDNIKLVETEPQEEQEPEQGTNMIKNGDFSEGDANWENSAGDRATVSFDGKAIYNIKDVGVNDYDVQLKQSGLKLEQGASYNVKFKISSTAARIVKYGFLDPTNGYKWYGGKDLALEAGVIKEVDYDFTVDDPTCVTSSAIEFYISMGKIADIDTPLSTIEIDDVQLYKTSEGSGDQPGGGDQPGEDDPSEDDPVEGEELIKNGDFSEGEANWEKGIYGGSDGKIPAADVTFSSGEEGKVTYNITNVGDSDWNIQLIQKGLTLEQGASYKVRFKITSTAARSVKYAFITSDDDWYGGETIALEEGVEKKVNKTITIDKDTSTDISFKISMGQMKHEGGNQDGQDIETPISTIEIDDVSVIKLSGGTSGGDQPGKDDPSEDDPVEGEELIKNGDFSEGEANWEKGIYGGSDGKIPAADVTFSSGEEGKVTYNITNVGDSDWNIQLIQKGLTLEQGGSYKVQFKIKSTAARSVKYAFLTSGDDWYGGETIALEEGVEKQVDKTIKIDKDTSRDISFKISMGQMKHEGDDQEDQDIETPISTIEIDDVSVVKLGEEEKASETIALKPVDKPIKEEELETDENVSNEPQDDDNDIAGGGDDEEQTEDDFADSSDSGDKSKNDSENDDNSTIDGDQDAAAGDNIGDEDTSGDEDISVEESNSSEIETDGIKQLISFFD